MATSDTAIANKALSAIGSRVTVSSLGEATPQARAANIWYESTRQQVARAANWQCNKRFVNAGLLKAAPGTPENPAASPTIYWDGTTQPPPPWLYEYAYPSDCLRMRYVQGQFQTQTGISPPIFATPTSVLYQNNIGFSPFNEAVDTNNLGSYIKVLLTNQSQAILTYTVDVLDPNVWDPGFQDAVVYALAGRIAMHVSGDKSILQAMFSIANSKLVEARANDANEMTTVDDRTPDWIAVRDGTPYSSPNGNGWIMAPYGPLFTSIVGV